MWTVYYVFTEDEQCMLVFKGGLLLKIKKLHIHLYFLATQYLESMPLWKI